MAPGKVSPGIICGSINYMLQEIQSVFTIDLGSR